MILTRKIQLLPCGDKEEIDRVYQYLRDGIFNQNKAMNQYISALYIAAIKDISKEDRKELNNLYGRISGSKKGSAYDETILFPKGLPTASSLSMKVRQDFQKSCKGGLLCGKVSLPIYKKDNPLLIHVDFVRLRSTNPHQDNGLYHNYQTHTEFLDHLYLKDLEIFIKFANNITFKLIFGNPHKSAALRKEIQQIFEEHYKVCGSSIQIVKDKRNGKGKIMLNLSMEVPKQETTLAENVVVGVDLGLHIPAVCALNNNKYIREPLGSDDNFLAKRTKIQNQRKRLYKQIKYTNGGHGRKKKMKPIERFSQYERNFVCTYNHKISRDVIDFALKHHAKYINLEDLSGYDTSKFILRNWSYYELQQFITYKAAKYGIVVRKINPYRTSQICSCCGHWEEGQRITQDKFVCANPDCESHKIYKNKDGKEYFNADFNAARNIAMSTHFVEKEVKPRKPSTWDKEKIISETLKK